MGAGCCKSEAIDFESEIELSHFHLLRSVGKGAFGKVRVVQHKRTKEIYALKYINKEKCIRMRAVENIIQERRLLEEVEFPLICNLRYAFQDDENLFMVLDLMLGGDLRFHLERTGPMREEVVRFYVAELALALDALHSRHIIHRDLKPDNVLLDEYGHAHLTDFNIAVYYNRSKPLLSIAGSMAYMAPEVLLRKGYFESVDWWSLGVVMFELLFGKRPFKGKSNELLTASILKDPLPFPENVKDMVSAQCVDVLSKLCERDITKRLGCTPEGLDGFKKHPWFQGIDWDALTAKEATAPFQPDSKRANFDATHELEELLMEDNPLKAKKRAQTTPETELSVERQMMEDKFIVYDFTKVRRPHSLSRNRILRPSPSFNDSKMSSGTLDGVVRSGSSGRVDSLVVTSPPKSYQRSDSHDRNLKDRYKSNDEEHIALTSPSHRHSPLSSPGLRASNKSNKSTESFRFNQIEELEKSDYFSQQQHTPSPDDRLTIVSAYIAPPASSLPRPLQPRDALTGLRTGFPRRDQYGNSPTTTSPTTPPSSGSSSAYSRLASSELNSPSTIYSSSINLTGQHHSSTQPLQGKQGSAFLPTSDPVDYNASQSSEPTGNDPIVARRAIRGREATGTTAVNSMPAVVPSSATNYGQRSPPLRHHQQHSVNIPTLRPERTLHHHHHHHQQQQQQQQQQEQLQHRQQAVEQLRPASLTTDELSITDDSTVYSSPSASRPIHYERLGMKSMPVRVGEVGGGGHGSNVKSEELPSQIQRQQALYATIGKETSS
ncbi:hypothetical protein BGZ75_000507 [Mortierella antarctica]|nr:hypothetical protein BGZ75_000507 [Mortierella antarctica]